MEPLRTGAAVGLGLLLAAAPATAQQRVYLAPDDHTDYMWTLDEAAYDAAFVEMLDYYLDQSDKTAGAPKELQARWNCDGSYWLKVYERRRGAAALDRLMARVRDGHVSVPLTTLVSTYGAQPAEAVLRGLYYGGQLERRYDVRLPLAVAQENQTLPLGLGALFAGAGARYSWRGICGCATQVEGAGDREREIYRWTGLDGSAVTMKWNSLLTGSSQAIGGYAEANSPTTIVDFLSGDSRFRARWPWPVSAAFGQGWDAPKTLSTAVVDAARAKTTAQRKVIVSNEQDFFEDFEAAHGKDLQPLTLAYGNEWDLYSASLVEVSASLRRAVEKLRAAEAMATLVSRVDPTFWSSRKEARDEAHTALGLYWEHNWTADGPISKAARAAWQRRLAATVTAYVDGLHRDAAAALGRLVAGGAAPRFLVFNALGFPRSDVVDLPADLAGPLRAIDVAAQRELPAQVVTTAAGRRLRVLVADVPAAGYRAVELQAGAPAALPAAAAADPVGGVLDGAIYRVTVSGRGAVTSLLDKRQSPPRELVRSTASLAANDLGPGAGTLAVENVGPVSVTLVASAAGPLKHTTRVTLYRDLDRLDLDNQIDQGFSDVRSWAFALNLTAPQVIHEEVGAVLRARPASQGGHYADRRARVDWLSLGHFADMSGGDAGVTLSSADLAFFKLGASTARALDTQTPQLSVLAGGQVDGPTLGIQAQGGDTRFVQRFSLRGHGAPDPRGGAAAAMRFALAHQNPLVAVAVSGAAPGSYPAATYSLVEISDPRVLLWALKPAEDGVEAAGVVLRLWNLGAEAADFTLRSVEPIGSARRTTHAETRVGELPVRDGQLSLRAAPQQLLSLSLWDGGRVQSPDGMPNVPDIVPGGGQPPGGDGAAPGCGCRVGGRSKDGTFAAALGLALLGWARRRRRR